MKVLITGHRIQKLTAYNCVKLYDMLHTVLRELKEKHGYIRGYAGMASGVDIWFCACCNSLAIPFVSCIPFDGQEDTMSEVDAELRKMLIEDAVEVRKVKNSWMVEECEMGIVIWDGNKGGTHNVVQQLIEKKKPFIWINPVSEKVWHCT